MLEKKVARSKKELNRN